MKKPSHVAMLNALLSNCKQSDRNIAKMANISQPTVTRMRGKLEATGMIKNYFAIPDYRKLGYEFGAVTLCETDTRTIDLSAHSPIVIASAIAGEGDYILITLHKNMEDYLTFLKKVKAITVVLFSTRNLEIKPVQVKLD